MKREKERKRWEPQAIECGGGVEMENRACPPQLRSLSLWPSSTQTTTAKCATVCANNSTNLSTDNLDFQRRFPSACPCHVTDGGGVMITVVVGTATARLS